MKTKRNTLLPLSIAVTYFMTQMVYGAVMVNDKSIINEDWSDTAAWSIQSGTGGASAPSASGGVLSMSMVGATGGGPAGVRNTSSVPLNYIATTRVKVTQFPDIASFDTTDSNNQGVQLVDIRGQDILTVAVTPTSIFINDQVSPGGHNWTEINVATTLDTYYTWQFQVSELAGNAQGGGTVDIYRRESDSNPFALVGSSELRGTSGSESIYAGRIWRNTEGSQVQGSLEAEYFQFGEELIIPEPSSAILFVVGTGFVWVCRRKRNLTV